MALVLDVPETLDSERLEVAGTYHFAIIHTDEQPEIKSGDRKGEIRDGFEVEAEVMAGPHKGRTARLFFRHGQPTDKDGGKFSRIAQGRFLEATNVTRPEHRGKSVQVELAHAMAQQFVATVKKNNNGYIELDGSKVWHIDDPSADKCERNQQSIGMIPKECRRMPESFQKRAANGAASNSSANGNGNGHSGQQPTSPAPDVDLNDI